MYLERYIKKLDMAIASGNGDWRTWRLEVRPGRGGELSLPYYLFYGLNYFIVFL